MERKKRNGLTKIGAFLKEHREASGMTQRKIAKKMGVTLNYVSLLETNQRTPSLATLAAFGKAIGAPLVISFDLCPIKQIS